MSEDIKEKSIKGVLWSMIESFSLKFLQFIINVIMARLLLPEDYGVVALIMVFIAISQIFIDGGFATALVQDKDKTERDYSTIFTFNILVSVICYLFLYVTAPFISEFYNNDITIYLRVQSLVLIIYAFSAIHKVKLTVDVNFKEIAKVSLSAAFVSGTIGIIVAYMGYGVWALVVQALVAAITTTVILMLKLRWKPICFFDKMSFRRLFPFGSRLLTANIIDCIYMNLYPIFVGKLYTPKDLGYFSRADQFSALPGNTCAEIFMRVTYPVMSSVREEDKLVMIYRKFISLSSYLIFPILFIILVLAKPLILILLTAKWIEIVLLMQILCCGYLLNHLSTINRNLLYVKGRADLALKLEVYKKVIATLILLISVPFGLVGLCVGKAFYGLLAMVLNSWYTKSLINVSLMDQFKDFTPSLLIGILSAVVALIPVIYFDNEWVQLSLGFIVYVAIYLLTSRLLRLRELNEIIANVRNLR